MIQQLKDLIPQRSPVRLCWHYAKGYLAALRYGFPARKLSVIGITGTDGKTTTVGMIAHILLCSGKKVGAASIKDMGKVMGELKKTHADVLDFSKVGSIIKTILN